MLQLGPRLPRAFALAGSCPREAAPTLPLGTIQAAEGLGLGEMGFSHQAQALGWSSCSQGAGIQAMWFPTL